MKCFLIVAIVTLLQWCATDSSAEEKKAVSLKDLILRKYDGNRDGALVGIEKDGAVNFLKKLDKDGNGEISEEEQIVAIKALQAMPDPKSTPAKVMKKEGAGGTGKPDIKTGERPTLFMPKKADKDYILYSKNKPAKNSPSEAYINLLLLTESGKIKEAEKLISKTAPDWLKKSFLTQNSKEHGPIKMETLRYQLVEIKENKYRVSFALNWKSGTHTSGSRFVIIEDGKWVVR